VRPQPYVVCAVPMPGHAGHLPGSAGPSHTSSGLGPALTHLEPLPDHAGAAGPIHLHCRHEIGTKRSWTAAPAWTTALVQCRDMCRSRIIIVQRRAVKDVPALLSAGSLHVPALLVPDQYRNSVGRPENCGAVSPHRGPALASLGAALEV
jgi:hypothetical protein